MSQPPPMGVIPPEMIQHGAPGQTPQPVNYYSDAHTTSDLTGGLPINLDSLRDGPPGSKPFYPYSTLIRYAIKGSPNQKLLLEDIYYAIESRFPYFRTAPPGWKNSVRHNLSLNPCFEKVPRPLTDRGKGSYWTVNDNVDPRTGVHRIRKKKGKPGSKGSPPLDSEDIDYHPGADQQPTFDPSAQFVPPPQMPAEAGPSRQAPPPPPPPPFPGPYQFDPAFPGMIPFLRPDELEVDDQGAINWHALWRKELSQLQQATEEQEKSGADQDWYRTMLLRVRMGMFAPLNMPQPGPEAPLPPPPHAMPGPPPNPGEVQIPVQVPMQEQH
ncbi:hypothetical protein C8T65DRAFT_679374 [Cerioporus squamosus]|nr:hypothetical protein C8T65DRAFT_679374 [Cerioporus squamosus]